MVALAHVPESVLSACLNKGHTLARQLQQAHREILGIIDQAIDGVRAPVLLGDQPLQLQRKTSAIQLEGIAPLYVEGTCVFWADSLTHERRADQAIACLTVASGLRCQGYPVQRLVLHDVVGSHVACWEIDQWKEHRALCRALF
jgi:hypothetical protein